MPVLTFNKTQGVQTIGPLAADTDFQVRSGSCLVSVSNPGADTNHGFERTARTDRADWHVGTGKTVYLQTTGLCTVFYEALV